MQTRSATNVAITDNPAQILLNINISGGNPADREKQFQALLTIMESELKETKAKVYRPGAPTPLPNSGTTTYAISIKAANSGYQIDLQACLNKLFNNPKINVDKLNDSLRRGVAIYNSHTKKISLALASKDELRDDEDEKKDATSSSSSSSSPPPYRCIISQESFNRICAYKKELESDPTLAEAGAYLKQAIATMLTEKNQSKLAELSNEDFIAALIKTKRTQIFAESGIYGNGSDWNQKELALLGDINISAEVTIYDQGQHPPNPPSPPLPSQIKPHKLSIKGTLLFTPGTLLRNDKTTDLSPDITEVVNKDSTINGDAYYALYKRRLLPLLMEANERAKRNGKKALITIPGLGCGVFAGKFAGKLAPELQKVLISLLENHGKNLGYIKAVVFDPYEECSDHREKIHGIDFMVRPSGIPATAGAKHNAQLCAPNDYAEAGDDFSDCELFSMVAWDHVSWPGNDFYKGNTRKTDDGVKSAATNMMEVMTGVAGDYRMDTDGVYKYMPPSGSADWNVVAQAQNASFDVHGKIFIHSPNQNDLLPLQGDHLAQQQFLYLNDNNITPASFSQHVQAQGLDPQKSVLIFPGNTGHHQANQNNLFCDRPGSGLASVANNLFLNNLPALSLPTTGMSDFQTNITTQDIARNAVADLWKAVGYGMNIVLPTREQGCMLHVLDVSSSANLTAYEGAYLLSKDRKNLKYVSDGIAVDVKINDFTKFTEIPPLTDSKIFLSQTNIKKLITSNGAHTPSKYTFFHNSPLPDAPSLEPSFWGEAETAPNTALAKYYIAELNKLKQFMADTNPDKKPPSEFATAYQQGISAKTSPTPDQWFQAPATNDPTLTIALKNKVVPHLAADDGSGTPLPATLPTSRRTSLLEDTSITIHANLKDYARLADSYAHWAWLAQGSWAELDRLAQIKVNCDLLLKKITTDTSLPPLAGLDKIKESLEASSKTLANTQTNGPSTRYMFCNELISNNKPLIGTALKNITGNDVKLDHFTDAAMGSVVNGTVKSAFVQGTRKDNTFVSEAYIAAPVLSDENKRRELIFNQIESFRADPRSFGKTIQFRGGFNKEHLIDAIHYCKLRDYKFRVDASLKTKIIAQASNPTKATKLSALLDHTSTTHDVPKESAWKTWLAANDKYPFSKLPTRDEVNSNENTLKLTPSTGGPEAIAAMNGLLQKALTTPAAAPYAPLGTPAPRSLAIPTKPFPSISRAADPAPSSTRFTPDNTIVLIGQMQDNLLAHRPCFENTAVDADAVLKQRIEACQRSVRVHASPTWQTWADGKPLEAVMKFTNPGYPDPDDPTDPNREKGEKLRAANVLAPGGKDPNRQYTKFRVITADVVLLNNDTFPIVSVMTTCAPNLMGTSTADLSKYAKDEIGAPDHKQPVIDTRGKPPHTRQKQDERRQLLWQRVLPSSPPQTEYEKTCQEQAELICRAAKEQGFKNICMPDFGLGVYLDCLTEESKGRARIAMIQAFAKAAKDNDITIDWIIYNKDENKKITAETDKEADRIIALSQAANPSGNTSITFKKGDLLEEMRAAAAKQALTGVRETTFINAGSDRTIGGRFKHKNPKTIEEQLAQQTSLLVSASAGFNPHVKAAYQRVRHVAEDSAFVEPTARDVSTDSLFPSPYETPIADADGPDDGIKRIKLFEHGLTYVPFYDKEFENYIFANYSNKGGLTGLDDKPYTSPEHYFHAQKFQGYPHLQKRICDTETPDAARKLALQFFNPANGHLTQDQINDIKSTWNSGITAPWDINNSYQAMVNVVRARCNSEPEFMKKLLATGTAYILEDTYTGPPGEPADPYWGGGSDGKGENKLGRALMQVRAELIKLNLQPGGKLPPTTPLTATELGNFHQHFEDQRKLARDERDKLDKIFDNIRTNPDKNDEADKLKQEVGKPLALAQRYARANSCKSEQLSNLCEQWSTQPNSTPWKWHSPTSSASASTAHSHSMSH